jgi:hypothetical protein
MLKHLPIAVEIHFFKRAKFGRGLIELCSRGASHLYISFGIESYPRTSSAKGTLYIPALLLLIYTHPFDHRIHVLKEAIYPFACIRHECRLRSNVFKKLVGLLISPDRTPRFGLCRRGKLASSLMALYRSNKLCLIVDISCTGIMLAGLKAPSILHQCLKMG